MPPPQLAADAPVLDIVHPFEISLRPVVRNEANAARFDGSDSRLRQWPDAHVPLVGEIRFDDRTTAITARYLAQVVVDLRHQSECLEIGDDFLACNKAIEATVRSRCVVVDRGVVVENVEQRQFVA